MRVNDIFEREELLLIAVVGGAWCSVQGCGAL
jgi:hypothetical protein